jgi:hypothetical protein
MAVAKSLVRKERIKVRRVTTMVGRKWAALKVATIFELIVIE